MLEKLLSRTVKEGDCCVWTGCINSDGYPRISIGGYSNGKAHREVFFLVNGYHPPVVRHTCDNIRCINPEHLLGGSATDNMRDRGERARTYHHVSDQEFQAITNLRSSGMSYKELSKQFNISTKRVEYICTTLSERRIRKFAE